VSLINAISVDLEDWYQVPLVRIPLEEWGKCKPAVEDAARRILDFFAQRNVKATFFTSGYIAARHADLIAEIAGARHEVESHAYCHRLAYQQSAEEFGEDIRLSTTVVEQITGERPIGYRSPAWSTSWIPDLAAAVLAEQGYVYDTSLFPTRNLHYGRQDFNTDTTYLYKDTGLLEIPPTVFDVAGIKVPVTGGFYLRAYPLALVKVLMRRLVRARNQTKPVQIYIHPWEVAADYPRANIPIHHSFIQYYNCGTMLQRLGVLMDEFEFGSLRQAYPQIEESRKLKKGE